MHVCTIIAKNYVAPARVLARSLAQTHPGSRLWTLVIDDFSGHIDPAQESFEILTPADIGCEEFTFMALRYSVLELSTAVKPWLLRHLMAQTGGPVTYLDPDIKIYGSLEPLDELAQEHGVVLIPHNSEPIPHDGRTPSQVDVMIAGIYNLGYVSLAPRPEVERLLDWWADRLRRDCRVDPRWGYFVDQRWFDLAPGFLSDLAIVRDPEYNLAYWNLHERRLEYEDGRYLVNGRALSFFHFSGFDPEHPLVLSRHQNRIDVLDRPVLERVLAEYGAEVMAEGHGVSRHWPYVYGALSDSHRLDDRLRALFDEFADERGDVVASPLAVDGARAFDDWLSQQAPAAPPGISRALAHVYESRADVRGAFPDLAGGDRAAFLTWAGGHGVAEEPLLARVMANGKAGAALEVSSPEPAVPTSSTRPSKALRSGPWGVNVVGDFGSDVGLSQVARQIVGALDVMGIPALPVQGHTSSSGGDSHLYATAALADAPFPVSVICLGPERLAEFVNLAGQDFFAGRYSVGLWFLEATRSPAAWREDFSLVEEVWAPTPYVAEALRPLASVPVNAIRIPVAPPSVAPPPVPLRARTDLGLADDEFLFLSSVDYQGAFERANPLGVIDAYSRAFASGERARLLLYCVNARRDRASHARLLEAAAGRGDIEIIDGDPASARGRELAALCDCVISLHRAVGFGMPLAEAIWLGKPVIATGYSGNLDYMNPSNSLLVSHRLAAASGAAGPDPVEAQWAEPDLEHAAMLMRKVHEDQDGAWELGATAARDIRRTHSLEVVGEILLRRLESIRATGRARRAAVPVRAGAAAALPLRIRQGPTRPAQGRGGAARELLRNAVLRVIRPYIAYQQTVNTELATALDELGGQLSLARNEAAAAHAARLAQLRHVQTLTQLLEDLVRRVQWSEAEARAIPYMSETPFVYSRHPVAGIVQGYRSHPDGASVDAYRSFEDIFRGSEAFIRDRQSKYVQLIGDREPVLDFGCGRGEFLDLVREHGRAYVGVDSDAGMVARCREKGHDQVVLADGLEYLDGLEPDSLGAIFCAQVIEHLPYEQLLRFFALARRALAPEGLLIAETVNPHSPRALKTFWVDLTHQHPVFPEVALALCRSAGFAEAFVFHPNGGGDIEVDRYSQGEYAVLATNPG